MHGELKKADTYTVISFFVCLESIVNINLTSTVTSTQIKIYNTKREKAERNINSFRL